MRILGVVILLSTLLQGCGRDGSASTIKPALQVAIDQETREAVSIDAAVRLPTPNPDNPRSQLKPALYCPQCERWYPAPPIEVLHQTRGAGKCPVHKTQLTFEGPFPESRIEFQTGEAE